MKLSQYINQNHLTYEAFAKKVGIPSSYISLYMNKKCRPSLKTIVKIQSATGGLVTAADFLPDDYPIDSPR